MVKLMSSPFLFFMLSLLLSGQSLSLALKVGINYGQIANNLPSHTQVATLLQSITINRVKLYDSDPNVLSAFADTNIEFIIAISNGNIVNMTDPNQATAWLKENVQPYLPRTKINCIMVGNEVFAGTDTELISNLLPAMKSMYGALQSLGLSGQINITTAHSLAVLGSSYPPSSGTFSVGVAEYIQPMLEFLSQTGAPFLINAYPFFAYKASPNTVSLPYVLFENNSTGITDPDTNLKYDNMLYAQIDSVYAAMKAMGYTDVAVRVSETGWPSKGDTDEPGATPENAASYNRNLLERIEMGQGTPLNPTVPVDVFVFALFNEDLKPGPTSERNYGLFYPNGTPVYSIGLQEAQGQTEALVPDSIIYSGSSSKLKVITRWIFLVLATAFLV